MASDVLRLYCVESSGGIRSDVNNRYLTPIMWEYELAAPNEVLVNTPIYRSGEKAALFCDTARKSDLTRSKQSDWSQISSGIT